MSSPMDMMRIQAQIRQNATEMADFFKDLNEWESEISRKDKAIKEGKIKGRPNAAGVRPPGFAEMIPSGVPGVKEKLMEQKAAAIKPKNYTQYRDWDKVDVDAIVAEMDRKDDLEKEDAARARLAKDRAMREAEAAAAAARVEQAIALKEEGNAWLKQGDLSGALQKYSDAIKLHPNDPVFFCNRAEVHLRMQSFDAAEQDCSSALNIDKRMTKALFRRGKARAALGNRTGAMEDFKKVLSFDPGNLPAQAEFAQLRSVAANTTVSASQSSNQLNAKSTATHSHVPASLSSQTLPRSSASARISSEPPSKPSAFKPGFLDPQPPSTKPRRIQIKEASDESDDETSSTSAPTAPIQSMSATAISSSDAPSSVKLSKSAVAVAAAAAAAVTDEDILARAARIASLNSDSFLSVPRNWHEFEKTWKTLRNNSERFDAYISVLPLFNWTAIFGSMMTGEALADILNATARLVGSGVSSPADTLERLSQLASLPRFKMLLMFLEPPSFVALRACIASAEGCAELSHAKSILCHQWGLV